MEARSVLKIGDLKKIIKSHNILYILPSSPKYLTYKQTNVIWSILLSQHKLLGQTELKHHTSLNMAILLLLTHSYIIIIIDQTYNLYLNILKSPYLIALPGQLYKNNARQNFITSSYTVPLGLFDSKITITLVFRCLQFINSNMRDQYVLCI